jgi:signal peptidase I
MLENTTSAPPSDWTAVRSALVADVLRREVGLMRQLVRGEIRGESMLPALWPGDVVEIESCSLEDVEIGEIVLAQRDDRLVMHRLIARCGQNNFLLRGDSVPCPDPQLSREALLGRLVRRIDGRRSLPASPLRSGFGAKWSRAAGLLLCHWGLARRLVLEVRSRRKKSARGFEKPGPAVLSLADLGSTVR